MVSYYNWRVEIDSSARKHGVLDGNIEHAVEHAMAIEPQDDGKTASGVPISKEMIDELSARADAGYDVDKMLRRRGGRPPMGSAASSVESVRLEPELREALLRRARADSQTTSAVIRRALREYLDAA